MRAAILARSHEPLIVDEVELPPALEVGQVLVRMQYAGICGSQLGEIDAVKGPDPYLPHLLGHEGCGRVEAVGPGVRRVGIGNRVVLHWRKAAGIEAPPPRYRWRGAALNAGAVTTFNELAILAENRLTTIDEDIPGELAAMLGCPVTTGLGTVFHEAAVRPGESVVIIGAGGVGLSEVLGARLVNADPIVVVDRTVAKLELSRRLGATHTVETGAEAEARIRAITGRSGADAVFENTGEAQWIEAACRLTAPQGRTVLVGVPRTASASIQTLPLHFGQRLIGSHGGATDPDRDIPRYLGLYRRRQLPLEALVTDHCNLRNIQAAIAAMRAGTIAGRCILHFEEI